MAVLKVIISITVIVIVAVKLEDVKVELQLPVDSLADLTTLNGLANVTASLIAGGSSSAAGSGAANEPALPAAPREAPGDSLDVDLNTTAGPLHVDAACLLQRKGSGGQFDSSSKTMCSYVFSVCAISLLATFIMAALLWCTCHLCGWGPILEVSFAVLGTLWWLIAALVLQENTKVMLDAAPAAMTVMVGSARSPPPVPPASLLRPPPPMPPAPPIPGDVASEINQLVQTWVPRSLNQWRQAVVVMSWVMMGLFAASSVLLLVEACGCVLDCLGCLCRCCCCPDRPESRWRARIRQRRKRLEGDEYVEMWGGVSSNSVSGLPPSTPSSSMGGAPHGFGPGAGRPTPPSVLVVARSDFEATSPESSSGGSFGRPGKPGGRGGWWR